MEKIFLIVIIILSPLVSISANEGENQDIPIIKMDQAPPTDQEDQKEQMLLNGQHKWNLSTSLNADLYDATDLIGVSFSYAYKLKYLWLETFGSYFLANFSAITRNPENYTTNLLAESNNWRPDNADQTLMIFGLGATYLDTLPVGLNIFEINNLYYTAQVFGTYTNLRDSYFSTTYTGFGIRVDYGLHKRIDPNTHLGIRLSYYLSEVFRAELIPDENSDDRRLFLSWISLGLDLSFYF